MLPQVYAVRVKVAAVENKDTKPAEVDGMFLSPLLTSSCVLREPFTICILLPILTSPPLFQHVVLPAASSCNILLLFT